MPPSSPAAVLPALLADDPARPRVTCYDDLPGPTAGERVELSARVIDRWVAKAGNALQEEWDAGPGSRVALLVRPHWRAVCWAVAAWTVGAAVVLDDTADDLDVVVTDTLPAPPAGASVYLTRASLARTADRELPPGTVDEAAELATFGDHLDPWDEPSPDDPALVTEDGTTSFAELLGAARDRWPDLGRGERADVAPGSTEELLLAVLAVWGAGGSVVLHVGGTDPATRARRAHDEGVTRSL